MSFLDNMSGIQDLLFRGSLSPGPLQSGSQYCYSGWSCYGRDASDEEAHARPSWPNDEERQDLDLFSNEQTNLMSSNCELVQTTPDTHFQETTSSETQTEALSETLDMLSMAESQEQKLPAKHKLDFAEGCADDDIWGGVPKYYPKRYRKANSNEGDVESTPFMFCESYPANTMDINMLPQSLPPPYINHHPFTHNAFPTDLALSPENVETCWTSPSDGQQCNHVGSDPIFLESGRSWQDQVPNMIDNNFQSFVPHFGVMQGSSTNLMCQDIKNFPLVVGEMDKSNEKEREVLEMELFCALAASTISLNAMCYSCHQNVDHFIMCTNYMHCHKRYCERCASAIEPAARQIIMNQHDVRKCITISKEKLKDSIFYCPDCRLCKKNW